MVEHKPLMLVNVKRNKTFENNVRVNKCARNNLINVRVKREIGINNHTEIFDFINYLATCLIYGRYFQRT